MCKCVEVYTGSPVCRKGPCRSIQRSYAVPLQRGLKRAGFPVGRTQRYTYYISRVGQGMLGVCDRSKRGDLRIAVTCLYSM